MKLVKKATLTLACFAAAGNAAWGQEFESRTHPNGARPSLKEVGDWDATFRIAFGLKALDEALWAPSDVQDEYSLLTDFGPKHLPLRIAVDFHYGSMTSALTEECDAPDFESSTAEFNVGLRYTYWSSSSVTLTLGGGLCVGWAEATLEGAGDRESDSDAGVGFWFGTGVDFNLGAGFTLGLEIGRSGYQIELLDVHGDGGGERIGFTFGWMF